MSSAETESAYKPPHVIVLLNGYRTLARQKETAASWSGFKEVPIFAGEGGKAEYPEDVGYLTAECFALLRGQLVARMEAQLDGLRTTLCKHFSCDEDELREIAGLARRKPRVADAPEAEAGVADCGAAQGGGA